MLTLPKNASLQRRIMALSHPSFASTCDQKSSRIPLQTDGHVSAMARSNGSWIPSQGC
jgi:hypothetical protein